MKTKSEIKTRLEEVIQSMLECNIDTAPKERYTAYMGWLAALRWVLKDE